MFFNKKTSEEHQREIRLTILQLEKLVERAIDNAKSAITAFDNSFDNLYAKNVNLLERTLHVAEFLSAKRFVENNEKILLEIEGIFKNKQIRTSFVLRESFKNAKEKNHHASTMFNVYHRVLADWAEEKQDPETFFVNRLNLQRNFRDDLFQISTSLIDFQDLFRGQYSISSFDYVHKDRLDELGQIENNDFDLSKLIRICEELNSCFQNENYLSIAMLVRATLDHVPPIFGFSTFAEVANNYGGKSLKKSLQNLQSSSRNIADFCLHGIIRGRENLPNKTQVDFRNDFDVLLGEIVRVLN